MITIDDFKDLLTDDGQEVRVYGYTDDDVVLLYEGMIADVPEKYMFCLIRAIDSIYAGNDGFIGLNIDMCDVEDDDEEDY